MTAAAIPWWPRSNTASSRDPVALARARLATARLLIAPSSAFAAYQIAGAGGMSPPWVCCRRCLRRRTWALGPPRTGCRRRGPSCCDRLRRPLGGGRWSCCGGGVWAFPGYRWGRWSGGGATMKISVGNSDGFLSSSKTSRRERGIPAVDRQAPPLTD